MRRAALTTALLAGACGGSSHKSDGGVDGGTMTAGTDLAPPPCVMNPQSGADILNGCTNSTTGDPAKDYPYHPKLAPNGNLPPLN